MQKIKAVIFEDELFIATNLKFMLQEFEVEVVSIYFNGEDFFNDIITDFDVAFVDIQLSGVASGIDVAEKLNQLNKPFAFVTANIESDTIEKAAKTWPVTYIPKPFNSLNIKIALELLKSKVKQSLKINSHSGKMNIDLHSILFIQSDDVYIDIYTETGKVTHRQLLKEIAKELPPNFVRVHRSYIVNKDKIVKVLKNKILIGEESIPISKSFLGDLS